MTEKPPTKGKRFFRIAKMTAKVAGNYASSKAKSVFKNKQDSASLAFATHLLNGELIAKELGQLKGAAMKVGQMASLAGDYLPPEMIEKLKTLQNDSPPMDYSVVEAQIESELGALPERLFDSFDEVPFKAASIGQVHRATLDGQELIVKIQYPGVDESCDSDLRQMRRIFKLAGFAYEKRIVDEMFEEFGRMLHEELDYTNEAQNIRNFREQHANDSFVIIPRVIGERSSGRILTMSYEEGLTAEEVRDTLSPAERNRIGENIFKLFGREFFRDRRIHADPHPGNFAFRADGSILLYDFGCVKEIPEKFIRSYRDLIVEGLAMRADHIDTIMFDLNIRKKGSAPIEKEFYQAFIDAVVPELTGEHLYDYSTSNLHQKMKSIFPQARRKMFSFQPNPEIALVDRLLLGVHNLFRIIGPEFAWRELIEEQIEYVK